jgi:hypothetical protein
MRQAVQQLLHHLLHADAPKHVRGARRVAQRKARALHTLPNQ